MKVDVNRSVMQQQLLVLDTNRFQPYGALASLPVEELRVFFIMTIGKRFYSLPLDFGSYEKKKKKKDGGRISKVNNSDVHSPIG